MKPYLLYALGDVIPLSLLLWMVYARPAISYKSLFGLDVVEWMALVIVPGIAWTVCIVILETLVK